MGIVYSSVVQASVEDVFAWHARPGAIVRLSPPWQPVGVAQESTSLRDGQAVLTLPGGLRWVAQHDADGYRPPNQFVDRLDSRPLRGLGGWRHQHEFAAVDGGSTTCTDRVNTPIPAGWLRPMFVYRHRQLADDLRAHAWASGQGAGAATIAVTGATGLIGTALSAFLTGGGHRVIRLVRHEPRHADERRWAPDDPDADLLAGVDAVVHLAGASIAGRFSANHKRAIYDSRIEPTRRLAALAAGGSPRAFIAASAVGYYGADRGEEVLTERSGRGEGFLADVVADWEAAAAPAQKAGLRVVHVRTGIVQSPRGGTLRLLRPLFAAGLGGRLGSGQQWLPWIGIDDLVDVYHRALFDDELEGPLNAVAPEPVRNVEYTRVLAGVLHRPALVPVPDIGPRLLLGAEGARELAQANQQVRPQRLLARGHPYRSADLEATLRHLLGRAGAPGG